MSLERGNRRKGIKKKGERRKRKGRACKRKMERRERRIKHGGVERVTERRGRKER